MKTKITSILFVIIAHLSYGQYEQYENLVMPYLSDSIQSGFFYFNTPNNFQPGQLYQLYRTNAPDPDNDMLLLETHVDSLAGLLHYKYQQIYKEIPVEGAGCIEHYQNNSLLFINAKIADSINKSPIPEIDSITAVKKLIDNLKRKYRDIKFAWDDEDWEQQIRLDNADSNATWYPTAELIWAIDTMKDVHLLIPGERFTLAYKISITTINPDFETYIFYVNANNGNILKMYSTRVNNGPADVYGYGSKIIDTQWKGGFTQKYVLRTNDASRAIHTKKFSNNAWWATSEIKDDNDDWDSTYLTETSTHYNVANSWDYYNLFFSRVGMDGQGTEIRVNTQYPQLQSYFTIDGAPVLVFGKSTTAWDMGMEPSIVGHEFTHGITRYTANLDKTYETGALDESYSDIFGIVIQAVMYDNSSTDWIIGNSVPDLPTRSLADPNSMGGGQPDTYNGTYWYTGSGDYGGIHTNSGVQNKWFYVLAHGESGQNDLLDYYNVSGIGMFKASKIAYYALTSFLMSSSQYSDSREATIQAAKILFGECSVEYKRTMDAWYAVGVGDKNNCTYTLSIDELATNDDVSVYPNPSNDWITIELSSTTNQPITIIDISGKTVKEFNTNQTHFKQDISDLNNGVYFIHFNLNGNHVVKKLIVQ